MGFPHPTLSLLKGLTLASVLVVGSSCIREESLADSPEGNFQALWQIIDEHYCYLDYKQIDWDAVGREYHSYLSEDMSDGALFEVLGNMLSELKDGHVNLYNSSNVSRYWDYYQDYPRNFSEELQEDYLGKGYRIAGGMKYTILDDNIGYIVCSSFSNPIGEGNLNHILQYMELCNGVIIDVRGNGGGNLNYAEALAARFTNERTLIGYIQHKTGKGHSDFSDPVPIYLEPSDGVRWQKPAAVLTNRHCFSSANYFVDCMKCFEKVTVVGDRTGGGSGLPFVSELPNGWTVRFSASPMLDGNMSHTEFGTDPDVFASLEKEDQDKGIDTIIETARQILNK